MKAFITGSEGFVGRHLSEYLNSQGIEVYGSYFSEPFKNKKRFFRIDVTDGKKLKGAISKVKPDYVFHLAAQSSVRKSWENPTITKKINVNGTENVLEAVKLLKMQSKVLIVSSAEVYGDPKKIPITEEHPLNPKSPYAESKLEAEKLCRNYDLQYFIVRSFAHIGPGQQPTFFCSEFAKIVAEIENGKREPLLTYGDTAIVRDLTDVRDVVRAYLLCLEKAREKEVYNICSGKGISIGEILSILTGYSNKKIKLQQDKSKVAAKSIKTLIGSYEKFYSQTWWKPRIEIEQTLKDILNYWRKNA